MLPYTAFGAIERGTDVVGILPNAAAIVRRVWALLLEQNHGSAVGRRDLGVETLALFGILIR